MREIKFRGKRIDNGEWVYGMPFSFKHIYLERNKAQTPYLLMFNLEVDIGAIVNYLRKPKEWTELEGSVWKIDPESVGQYIGLKDNPPRNSLKQTEIYDGDIIRLYTYFDEEDPEQSECTVHKVEYQLSLDYPGFDLVPYGDWECNGLGWAIADSECAGFEVIGNMTDSPELLEERR